MTQEDKKLLLTDLGARLQYKLHCRVFKLNEGIKENDDILYGIIGDNVMTLKSDKDECLMYYQIKPYLRPMSSMTDEEKKSISKLLNREFYVDNEGALVAEDGRHRMGVELMEKYINFLDKNYFDHRGQIKKGLAIEAPKDMYTL